MIPPSEAQSLRDAVAPYVLMKRGLYYRPNNMGYTAVLDEAGRYTEADAARHRGHNDGVVPVLAAEAERFSPACWPETRIRIAEQERDIAEARVATLTAERDAALEMVEVWKATASDEAEIVREMDREKATLTARLAEVEAALEPFAREADRIDAPQWSGIISDNVQIWQAGNYTITRSQITYGNLRAARSVLSNKDAGHE